MSQLIYHCNFLQQVEKRSLFPPLQGLLIGYFHVMFVHSLMNVLMKNWKISVRPFRKRAGSLVIGVFLKIDLVSKVVK